MTDLKGLKGQMSKLKAHMIDFKGQETDLKDKCLKRPNDFKGQHTNLKVK